MKMDSSDSLPTGIWTGFFLEPHHRKRGWMHLYLEFQQLQIRGEGTDYVGPWTISGHYDPASGECRWTKHYLGKHQVEYSGRRGENGIEGSWTIRGWLTGQFHIWPASNGRMHQMYSDSA